MGYFLQNHGKSGMRNLGAVMLEVDKCEVLCANCHWIEHYEDRLKPKPGAGRPRKKTPPERKVDKPLEDYEVGGLRPANYQFPED